MDMGLKKTVIMEYNSRIESSAYQPISAEQVQTVNMEHSGVVRNNERTWVESENTRYQCPECDKTTSTAYDLKLHMNLHTGAFRCEVCELNLRKQSSLDSHLLSSNHLKKIAEKEARDKQLNTLSLVSHSIVSEPPIHLNTINELQNGTFLNQETYFVLQNIDAEKMDNTGKERFQCPECDKTTSTKDNLKRHMNLHTNKYRCYVCEQNFNKQSALDNHERSPNHNKKLAEKMLGNQEQVVVSESWNPNYLMEENLLMDSGPIQQHRIPLFIQSNPSEYKPVNTDETNIVLGNNGERFQCLECKTTTKHAYDLKLHMNLHTGAFRCEVCGINLRKQSSLDNHRESPKHLAKVNLINSDLSNSDMQGEPDKPSMRLFTQKAPSVAKFYSSQAYLNRTTVEQPKLVTENTNLISSQPSITVYDENIPGADVDRRTPVEMIRTDSSVPLSLFDKIQQFQKASSMETIQLPQNKKEYTSSSIFTLNGISKEVQAVKEKDVECDLCIRKFTSSEGLRKHKIMHTD